METRFHTQEVVENTNPHQNRKDNPPQELRCGRAHVGNIGDQGHHQGYPRPAGLDRADDRDEMEASGTRAPRALGHLVFLLINFSDVCTNFISFLRGRKGSGTRVFGH